MSSIRRNDENLDILSILQWDIRGFNSTNVDITAIKRVSIISISNDVKPDVICLQEGRVHYQSKQQEKIENKIDNVTTPSEMPNYFCYISNNKLYDAFFKKIIHVNNKCYENTEEIHIPPHTTTTTDAENHHWIKLTFIHPTKQNKSCRTTPILLASYYRSPNRNDGLHDVI